jgi:hypothetical protein
MEARSLFTKSLSLSEMERFLRDYDDYIRRNFPPGYAPVGGRRTTHHCKIPSFNRDVLIVEFNWGSGICRYEVFVFLIGKSETGAIGGASLLSYLHGIQRLGELSSRMVGASVEIYEKPWPLTAELKRQLRAAGGAKGQRMPLNEREERIALISLL